MLQTIIYCFLIRVFQNYNFINISQIGQISKQSLIFTQTMGNCCHSTSLQQDQLARKKQYNNNKNEIHNQYHNPKNQQATRFKNKNGSDDQHQDLIKVSNMILSNNHLMLLLDKRVFDYLNFSIQNQHWVKKCQNALTKLLQNYVKYSVKLISAKSAHINIPFEYNLTDYGFILGNDIRQLKYNHKNRNHQNLRTLQFSDQFTRYKFSMQDSNVQEYTRLQKAIKQLSYHDPLAIFYLVSYLKKCCKSMVKQSVAMEKVNKQLKQFVETLNQNFSSNYQFSVQMLYVFVMQQDQFKKLKSEKFPYKKAQMRFSGKDKKKQINKNILMYVQMAKQFQLLFFQLTYPDCIKNGGFGYNLNLKVRNQQDQTALKRVKQKLLKDKIQLFYKDMKFQSKTIRSLRKQEFKYKKKVMSQIYKNIDELELTVTDLLRGRCMYKKLSQINKTANDIIQKVKTYALQGKDVQIVQIDNRLQTQTNDIVLKIRLKQIVAEFQLALRFNQTQSQIYHQMYQISRSQMLSPIVQLYEVEKHSTNQFFPALEKVIESIEQPKQLKQELKKKLKQLEKFIRFQSDNNASDSQQQEVGVYLYPYHQLYVMNNISYQRVHFLQKQTLIRTGDFFTALGETQLGLKCYNQVLQSKDSHDTYLKDKAESKILQTQKKLLKYSN